MKRASRCSIPSKPCKPGAQADPSRRGEYKGLPKPLKAPSNEFVYMTWEKRRSSKPVFARPMSSSKILSRRRSCIRAYIEPHSCVVKANEPDGSAEIWCVQQSALRDCAIKWRTRCRIPQENSGSIPCNIGGDFGGKGDFMDVAGGRISCPEGRPAGQNGDGLRRRVYAPAIRVMPRSSKSKPA